MQMTDILKKSYKFKITATVSHVSYSYLYHRHLVRQQTGSLHTYMCFFKQAGYPMIYVPAKGTDFRLSRHAGLEGGGADV